MAKYIRADSLPAESQLRKLIVDWGFIPLFVATGIAMTGFMNFWAGFGILTLGMTAYVGQLWFYYNIGRKWKIIGSICLIAIYLLIIDFMFLPAPINVTINRPDGNYSPGQNILGVTWQKDYTPVTIDVSNDTDIEYTNFDSYYRVSNSPIMKVGVYGGGVNNCAATAENTAFNITHAEMHVDGSQIVIPLVGPDAQAFGDIYRVRCDKLSPRSRIALVVAAAGNIPPKWIIAQIYYEAANRHRSQRNTKCFEGLCSDIPIKFIGGER